MATRADHLSRLPDELLLVIISLLPMKDAVRSSVLSKRWRYLYASRSDLEIDSRNGFVMDVVDRVRICPINKFSLSIFKSEAFDPCCLEGWINCVIRHAVREIKLFIYSGLVLPSNLFTCETLVKLSFMDVSFMDSSFGGPLIEVPAKVFLPNLIYLSLSTAISFHKDDDGVERLLSNCPALESFDCIIRDNECRLIVSSPTLKHLGVKDQRDTTREVINSFEIVINAPNLDSLSYYAVFDVDSHRLINAKRLTDASLSFCIRDGGNVDNWVVAATDLITGISGVRSLSIAGHTLENVLSLNIPIPVFHHTTDLEIFDEELGSFADLLYVLSFFESLEVLTLEESPSEFDLDDGDESEESRPSCLSFGLKRIRFFNFKGEECEMKMVEYFLENAKALDVLDIDIYEGNCEEVLEITKKLLMLPRASDKCKVVVTRYRSAEGDYE